MNLKVALLSLSLTALSVGNTLNAQTASNTTTNAVLSKSQFNTKIAAYKAATGNQSNLLYKEINRQMRYAISDLKEKCMTHPNDNALKTKIKARIAAFDQSVKNAKANNKSAAITALESFATTL